MSDPVALALVGAGVTLGGAIIANVFVLAKIYVTSKLGVEVAEESVRVSHNNAKAIQAVAMKTEVVHSAINQLEAFRAETSEARKSAEARLEEIRGGGA